MRRFVNIWPMATWFDHSTGPDWPPETQGPILVKNQNWNRLHYLKILIHRAIIDFLLCAIRIWSRAPKFVSYRSIWATEFQNLTTSPLTGPNSKRLMLCNQSNIDIKSNYESRVENDILMNLCCKSVSLHLLQSLNTELKCNQFAKSIRIY